MYHHTRNLATLGISVAALAVGVTDGSPTKKMALGDNSFEKVSIASKQPLTAYKFGKIIKTGAFTRFSDS